MNIEEEREVSNCNLEEQLEEKINENKLLEERLKHLLKSEYISFFDEKDSFTGEYILDINEIDRTRRGNVREEELITDIEDTLKKDREDLYNYSVIKIEDLQDLLNRFKELIEYRERTEHTKKFATWHRNRYKKIKEKDEKRLEHSCFTM